MVITYQDLVEYVKTRYRFSVVRCMHCYAVYCDRKPIPSLNLDEHLHCCSQPFVLYWMPKESDRISGVYNLNSKLLVLGIEFL